MRSVLAGLRRLVVPWGARPTDSAVIIDGDPEPVLVAAGQEAAVIWQYSPDGTTHRGFIMSVEPSVGFDQGGQLFLYETDFQLPLFTQQLLDFTAFTDGSGQVNIALTADAGIFLAWNADKSYAGSRIPPPKASNYWAARAVDSTATVAYADFVGSPSFQFEKEFDHTDIRVDMHSTWFASTTTTGVAFGVNISGDNHEVAVLSSTVAAGVHLQVSGTRVITGVGSGLRTFKPIWRRYNGSGTCQANADDLVSISVSEVAPSV